MKFLKKFFYGLIILIMLVCAGILVLAFSPDMTKSLSESLYGENGLLADVGKAAGANGGEDPGGDGMLVPDAPDSAYQIADGVLATEDVAGYVAPVRGALKLPDAVSDKNGYQPVNASGEELAEEQVQELDGQIGTGVTGDEYDFSEEFYPYYHMLNAGMQHLYRQIYANALQLTDSFAPVEQVNTAQLKNVFEAVYNDHPELFWLETGYSCKYRSGGECVEITLSYNRTAKKLDQAKKEFESAAQSIVNGASNYGSETAKEMYVHDELIKKAGYSLSAAMNQSAYSALVTGDTVCAGYSRAFQYLMQQLGIPCYYCTGYSGEDHAWNIVRIGTDYYNVDVTWDDTEPSTYDYFNKTDAQFVGTHVRTGLSVYLPPCGSMEQTDAAAVTEPVGNTVAGITLNPNPQQPLTWVPKKEETKTDNQNTDTNYVSGGDVYSLEQAGLSADTTIQTSLKAYYENCLKQMVDRGGGQQSFSNVVPKYLLAEVEKAYGTGEYQTGYVNDGLKKLELENFAIQIQVQSLGGNYYRLYHNIYTW